MAQLRSDVATRHGDLARFRKKKEELVALLQSERQRASDLLQETVTSLIKTMTSSSRLRSIFSSIRARCRNGSGILRLHSSTSSDRSWKGRRLSLLPDGWCHDDAGLQCNDLDEEENR